MRFSEYYNYFETVAINHKQLLHDPGAKRYTFFSIDMVDFISDFRNKVQQTALYLETYEFSASDQKSDNIRKEMRGAFLILKGTKPGDKTERNSILEETESVAIDVISKMINDAKKKAQDPSYNFPIKGFDVNNCQWQKIGPEWTTHYGWRVEFTFNQTFPNGLFLDESKWNNETKFSI